MGFVQYEYPCGIIYISYKRYVLGTLCGKCFHWASCLISALTIYMMQFHVCQLQMKKKVLTLYFSPTVVEKTAITKLGLVMFDLYETRKDYFLPVVVRYIPL